MGCPVRLPVREARVNRILQHQGWGVALFVLFWVLLAATWVIQPDYGVNGVVSLVGAAVPYAFAVAAQTVVVIGGGIDLSVAAVMAVTSVTAARLMAGESEAFGALVVVIVLLEGLILGAINGALIVLSRVPDIIVTLAMLFVWQGVALLVLPSPGGGAALWLRALLVGSVSTDAV